MANKAYEHDFMLVNVRRPDATYTTIALKSDMYFELMRRYPVKKTRVAAVRQASNEYEAMPAATRGTRTGYIRDKLLS